jgi:Short C-terminal domain
MMLARPLVQQVPGTRHDDPLGRRRRCPGRGGSPLAGQGSAGPARPTPLDVLKERFARGEIDQEEFEVRRRALSE